MDTDGCPEPDRDGDGVPDPLDERGFVGRLAIAVSSEGLHEQVA